MSYYQLLIGFDLTIFPSYYEPWGYTPLESIAFGVPTITTDLAGFGQWVLDTEGDNLARTGVKVVHRTDSNYSETVAAVSQGLSNVYTMMPAELRKARNAAKKTSKLASWDNFIQYYELAYSQALKKVEIRMVDDADGL
jgi:glycosyltransferase involved in cell wall biosynthesis